MANARYVRAKNIGSGPRNGTATGRYSNEKRMVDRIWEEQIAREVDHAIGEEKGRFAERMYNMLYKERQLRLSIERQRDQEQRKRQNIENQLHELQERCKSLEQQLEQFKKKR
ncbi:MAG: hypothetical protein KA069_02470 [Candidatus Saccharimonas sp.]|nr:hypothetical protein [Candidatus Saccharimonas sp.]